ncbi:MAG: hypothetical protein EG825_10275 [Rhodocyclaceae bacterium]|nr:hypothetical protein [Rhodocyclaceae bacterium]
MGLYQGAPARLSLPKRSGRKYNFPENAKWGQVADVLPTIGTTYWCPFIIYDADVYDQLWVYSGTNASGGSVDLGIYSDARGTPGNLIAGGTNLAIAAAATSYAWTFPGNGLTLPPGVYWFAFCLRSGSNINFKRGDLANLQGGNGSRWMGGNGGGAVYDTEYWKAVTGLPSPAGTMGGIQQSGCFQFSMRAK